MIDHKRKLIFIHIPKTGGESIVYNLTGEVDRGNRPGGDKFEGSVMKHLTIDKYIHTYGPECGNYFIFTIVRNPWERLISWLS